MEIRIREGSRRDHDVFWWATIETAWEDLPADERNSWDRSDFEANLRPRAKRVLTAKDNTMLVAESERGEFLGYAIVGAATSMLSPEPFGFLYDLWVSPQVRRHGVARALLEGVADWCRVRGIRRMKLEVSGSNNAARSLYASAGFAEERIFMGKTLLI